MTEKTKRETRICLQIQPGGDTRIFRLRAADDVLRLLIDAHESKFSMTELADATDHSRSTVWRAVNLLDELDIVEVDETSQRKYVSINPAHLQKDDPILSIEQTNYHDPVRAFIQKTKTAIEETDEVNQLLGILIFGSVARGEADRKSDIDIFVLVDGDRTVARRVISDIAAELGEKQFDGDRYTFEPFVESVESAQRAGQKLRDIFQKGITVYGGDEFQQVRTEVISSEQ